MSKTIKCACGCGSTIAEGRTYLNREHAAAHGRSIARERRAQGLGWKRTEQKQQKRRTGGSGRVVDGTYTGGSSGRTAKKGRTKDAAREGDHTGNAGGADDAPRWARIAGRIIGVS